MTDVSSALIAELVARGLERREAVWLVDEYVPGNDPDAAGALRVAAQRRLDGEPLQYVLGHWPFRNLDLDVDARVLIPRPESEELVTFALEELAKLDVAAPLIMDLGCGSGAIGLSLLDELRDRGIHASLIAVDLSPDALAVAKRNALKHSLVAVSFVASSWFTALDASLRGTMDLIVANPPYVAYSEEASLDPVLEHEPRMALFADDYEGVGGFADVAHIINEAKNWLRPGGVLVMEHSDRHGDEVVALANSAAYSDVVDRSDLAGHPRVLIAPVCVSGRLSLVEAAAAIAEGSVIAVPTDTVYGVAGSITSPQALAALFTLKQRPENVALPVLIASIDNVADLDVVFDERAEKLARAFWPGPLTIVVPAGATLARSIHSSRDVVGLRVPDDATACALLEQTGPLALTSANSHGLPPCTTAEEVLSAFAGRDELAGVLDDGPRDGDVSTVVDVADEELKILRLGALSEAAIIRVLNED